MTEMNAANPAVHEALVSRRSVRRFLPEPIPRETIERILTGAAYAPSGHNIQPWQVYVATGATQSRVTEAVLGAIEAGEEPHEEFDYYPVEWFEPYIGRRRAVGFGLYEKLGIKREDKARRAAQMLENFKFFGAPVGIFVTFDRRLSTGTFMDIGMFIENILIGARGEGLHTCGQVAWCGYHKVIRPILGIPDEQQFVCGISMGHEDTSAPENALRVEKLTPDQFTTWLD
ncbi:nitroreductase [Rhodobacteraceae bacterium NNCM2]|nr:nitroreductase [Coraliihabitans acroporae]